MGIGPSNPPPEPEVTTSTISTVATTLVKSSTTYIWTTITPQTTSTQSNGLTKTTAKVVKIGTTTTSSAIVPDTSASTFTKISNTFIDFSNTEPNVSLLTNTFLSPFYDNISTGQIETPAFSDLPYFSNYTELINTSERSEYHGIQAFSATTTMAIDVLPSSDLPTDLILLYVGIASIGALAIILLIVSHLLKNTNRDSKFGRRSSNGTLNTFEINKK